MKNPLKKESSTGSPYQITCKCSHRFKITVECSVCGVPPSLDDPAFDDAMRLRLIRHRQREVRQLRSWSDVAVHFWIKGCPRYRRSRALAAKGYKNGHVWPPIPSEAVAALRRPPKSRRDPLERLLSIDDGMIERLLNRPVRARCYPPAKTSRTDN